MVLKQTNGSERLTEPKRHSCGPPGATAGPADAFPRVRAGVRSVGVVEVVPCLRPRGSLRWMPHLNAKGSGWRRVRIGRWSNSKSVEAHYLEIRWAPGRSNSLACGCVFGRQIPVILTAGIRGGGPDQCGSQKAKSGGGVGRSRGPRGGDPGGGQRPEGATDGPGASRGSLIPSGESHSVGIKGRKKEGGKHELY